MSAPQYRMAANGHVHVAHKPCGEDSCVPVVVISPSDREQVQRLMTAYLTQYDGMTSHPRPGEVHDMQAALRSLVTPPGCRASITIGGVLIECERDNDDHLTDHRNDSIGQGIRWSE